MYFVCIHYSCPNIGARLQPQQLLCFVCGKDSESTIYISYFILCQVWVAEHLPTLRNQNQSPLSPTYSYQTFLVPKVSTRQVLFQLCTLPSRISSAGIVSYHQGHFVYVQMHIQQKYIFVFPATGHLYNNVLSFFYSIDVYMPLLQIYKLWNHLHNK